ncbi:YdbH domain-containing protein [Erythrobacter sp. JK5]|uniref:intermembrane phospholipid transport protein YdbH family protein n=1 Tax=Erythrobacter sp. JK5 TaxID=2829500 RepID=UPI001BABBD96|nr:YdbH domain-containing protein [Erythrobacter sp. JK5]QUL38480.1 YdbH domain-containing protein [Erythrobacter sp. JK5]
MAAAEQDRDIDKRRRWWPRRKRWRTAIILLATLLIVGSGAWTGREQIAGDIIDDVLRQNGMTATYEIVSIGPQQQVFENLVIGDPEAPDFTAERVVVDLEYGFGTAELGRIAITGARLFGTFREGEFSFGTLDPLLFAETDEPAGLPPYDVSIVDGRARIDGDFGVVGIKLDGEGPLQDGFSGTIAATSPGMSVAGCRFEVATLYGDIATADGAPSYSGPVRLRGGECDSARFARLDIAADLSLDREFTAVDGEFGLTGSELSGFGVAVDAVGGDAALSWGDGGLALRHALTATALTSPYGDLAELALDGQLRAAGDPLRSEWTTRIEGEGARLPLGNRSALAEARAAADGTFAGPLLVKMERSLARAANNGSIVADATVRQSGDGLTLIVPEARLRGSTGETLAAVSRLSWSAGGRLRANIATGGEGLPRLTGRMEQLGGGDLALRLAMQEYRAGSNWLAVPELLVRSSADGSLSFDGRVAANGAVPGGAVERLVVPVEGTWSPGKGLALGRRCTTVSFARLSYYEVALDGRRIALCPEAGRAILAYDDALSVRATTGRLALTGALAGSPLKLDADGASFAYPGVFGLDDLSVVIGASGEAVRLTAARFDGSIDDTIGGAFADGTARLDIVPLDLDELAGDWRYADGVLSLDRGAFRLTERTEEGVLARFEPLFARDATLTLDGNAIAAQADLREPDADRLITSVAIAHDLGSGTGQARLDIPGVRFDDALQPDQLSYLASGVIAQASGTIAGEGLITWTADDIASTGSFTTDRFDFAAAFGPVSSVRGTMAFSDLLGMTTAPGQVLEVGSVNPGIEVIGGRVVFQLRDGQVLSVEDARWPFMGGELILRPVTLDYGESNAARYVFEIVGLDAAKFITQMELTNVSATGTFDGTIPVVFDTIGNGRIEEGLLISRSPGGNVAYIGELTYEDLGTMGNYAFQALRSLDYTQMSVGLSGDLAGEIITSFKFDGISQGEGTTRNFVTRQLARLPIRFNINVRAENFYELSTVVRSFFDPTFLGNPVDRGLFDARDGRFVPTSRNPRPPSDAPEQPPPDAAAEVIRPDESTVQPPESEELP